ncbi:hypothetical protein ACJZ2D_006356 [Fusarium nematophilum]
MSEPGERMASSDGYSVVIPDGPEREMKISLYQTPRVEDNPVLTRQREFTVNETSSAAASIAALPVYAAGETTTWKPPRNTSAEAKRGSTLDYLVAAKAQTALAIRLFDVTPDWLFKVKILVGGVNVASPTSQEHQDYFVAPDQEWIYGVRVRDDLVRQFQVLKRPKKGTMRAMTSFSFAEIRELARQRGVVVEQPSGEAEFSVPTGSDAETGYQLQVRSPKGDSFALTGFQGTVDSLQQRIQEKTSLPVEQMRLIWAGKQLVEGRTLEDHGIPKKATIYVCLRLRGGGVDGPTLTYLPQLDEDMDHEMVIGTGGLIRQRATKDTMPERWDEDCSWVLRFHIINAEDFERVTGLSLNVPPREISPLDFYGLPRPPLVDNPEGLDGRILSRAMIHRRRPQWQRPRDSEDDLFARSPEDVEAGPKPAEAKGWGRALLTFVTCNR